MSEHALLSPSSAARWLRCPGSVALCAAVPDAGSDAARQGTLCHSALRALLEENCPYAPGVYTVDGHAVEYTEEMRSWVEAAAAWVQAQPGSASRSCELCVPVGEAFGRPRQLWGTADVVFYDDETLTVVDAKFGFETVEAVGNEQLSLYALGVAGSALHWPRYRLVILQPRDELYPVREDVLTRDELRARRTEYAPKVARALGEGSEPPDLVPGEVQCKWCRAAATCPALSNQALALAELEFLPDATVDATTVAAAVLDAAPNVELLVKRVREWATRELALGRDVPGWKLVEKDKHRQWKDEKEAAKTLKMLGATERQLYPRKLLSPAQAEKLLKLKPKSMEELAPRPRGEPTLARESDPRPALNPEFAPVLEGHDGE